MEVCLDVFLNVYLKNFGVKCYLGYMKRKHQEKQVGASARFKLLAIYLMWLESSRWITVYRRVKQEMEKSISAKTSAKHILFFETIMTSIRVWTLKEWKRTSITILSKFAFRIEYQLNHPNGIDDKWQWTGMKSTSNICSTLVRTIYQRCPFAQSLKSVPFCRKQRRKSRPVPTYLVPQLFDPSKIYWSPYHGGCRSKF